MPKILKKRIILKNYERKDCDLPRLSCNSPLISSEKVVLFSVPLKWEF